MLRYSTLKLFVVLISLSVAFGHPRKQTKITLSSDELRRVVIDLIKSEVASQINPTTAIPASQDLATQISEIQQIIAELQREVVEVTQTFQQQTLETHQECRAVRLELSSEDSNDNTTNIKDTLVRMSEDVRQIKQSLQSRDLRPSSASTLLTPYAGKSNLSRQEFDDLIQTKIPTQKGLSFSGRSLSSIIDAVSEAGHSTRSVTIVFVNHLEEALTEIRMHDPKHLAYHRAPSSVSPHTEEVFTFKEPVDGYVDTSFSYKIPSTAIRIAAFVRLSAEVDKVGLAFISEHTDVLTYYNSMDGIRGSSQQEVQNTTNVLNLSVGYQSFYARMQVTPLGTANKASIRLEIIDARPSNNNAPTTTSAYNFQPTSTPVWDTSEDSDGY